jgi:heme a synthase
MRPDALPGSAPAPRNRRLGWWLGAWSVMVLLTVVIGGITRLTESGLSITEWRPVTGVLPPLSAEAWEAEFAKYREIPQFRLLAPDMTLDGFKWIYFWEYLHRLWARVVGLAIAVPGLLGLALGWFRPPVRGRIVVLGLLTLAQGVLGWYMVASGLSDRTDVSQYRLAAHLSLALVLFMVALWTAADLLGRRPPVRAPAGLRRHALAALGLVLLTAVGGAFVAGTNAGKVYNEFPLMAGRVVPAGYLTLDPWYRNLFENVAAVQFNHRLLAVLTVLVVVGLAARLWRAGAACRGLAAGLAAAVTAQFALGIVTLLFSVPLAAAVLHQAVAVVLLGLALLAVREVRGPAALPLVAARTAAAPA